MDRKIVMLLIGLVAIGMFALPNTLAMYSGQHDFVSGSNVDCDKCHGSGTDAIWSEINTVGDPHYSLGSGGNTPGDSCEACHGFTGMNNVANTGDAGHAATTAVLCLDCHDAANLAAIVDGDALSVNEELDAGPHGAFYNKTSGSDPNLACLGCHTGATTNAVDITAPVTAETIDMSLYTYGDTT